MRTVRTAVAGAIALFGLASFSAFVCLWWSPVGLNNYVNKITLEMLLDSPEWLTHLGLIDDTVLDFHSGKLDEQTAEFDQRILEKMRKARKGLDGYGPDGLSGQDLFTWKVAASYLDNEIRQREFAHGVYRVNQLFGPTVDYPQFLTDVHVIKSKRSAERYLSRLMEFGRVLREVRLRVEDDRDHGVVPPGFIIDQTLVGMRAFIAPGPDQNVLVTSLPAKLEAIKDLSPADRQRFVSRATELAKSQVIPGYEALIALFEDMRKTANHDAGIWRLPQGEAIYAAALKSHTTTDLSVDQIHAQGLAEVARIKAEMLSILDAQAIEGSSLTQRMRSLAKRPDQLFSDDAAGRTQMLEYLRSKHARIMAVAPQFFDHIPTQPLEIVPVPEYAQHGSAGGYYTAPAMDGSRPGRFYINQVNAAENPRYSLTSFLVHEGAPGHHFQISLAQNIKNLVFLRRLIFFTAYDEGWALYAERIAKTDLRLYDDDPLADLGRLDAEMFRAVRLVVDTGLHAKRWSREQAVDYMMAHTAMERDAVQREIDRYVVLPGQATAYKVGQLAMLRMRDRAERELGSRFDVKGFHSVLLMNGALPLEVLEKAVGAWVESRGKAD